MTKEELRKEATTTVEWESTPMIDRPLFVHAYITGAEPREKQIQIDAEQIRALQKQNGELTDKVKELEAQLADKGDCECLTCVCRDSSCTRSDYGKDEIGLCKRYKSIYELHKELEAQIEKMKLCQICKHYQWESCNYHSLNEKDCKANNHRLFELKEIKEND